MVSSSVLRTAPKSTRARPHRSDSSRHHVTHDAVELRLVRVAAARLHVYVAPGLRRAGPNTRPPANAEPCAALPGTPLAVLSLREHDHEQRHVGGAVTLPRLRLAQRVGPAAAARQLREAGGEEERGGDAV
eukprot:5809640-Prymnesium_polylepis.1